MSTVSSQWYQPGAVPGRWVGEVGEQKEWAWLVSICTFRPVHQYIILFSTRTCMQQDTYTVHFLLNTTLHRYSIPTYKEHNHPDAYCWCTKNQNINTLPWVFCAATKSFKRKKNSNNNSKLQPKMKKINKIEKSKQKLKKSKQKLNSLNKYPKRQTKNWKTIAFSARNFCEP